MYTVVRSPVKAPILSWAYHSYPQLNSINKRSNTCFFHSCTKSSPPINVQKLIYVQSACNIHYSFVVTRFPAYSFINLFDY